MVEPPRWSEAELKRDLAKSTGIFRKSRLEEPLEDYSTHFDSYSGKVEELLETTVDLTDNRDETITRVLADDGLRQAFRYLPGPPISEDDLETLVDCGAINARELKKNPGMASKVAETVMTCLDRRRFPWVSLNREATEGERQAAVLASASLMATQRTQTIRRNVEKENQEAKVHDLLISIGFKEVARRKVNVIGAAPATSEFCGETYLGTKKADFLAGNLDRRVLAIECKVSNSSINSVKRLNGDAAIKAENWSHDFGSQNVVPIAVLSGVYKIQNLLDAQNRGLTLIWAHSLESLSSWIVRCAPAPKRR